MGRTIEMSRDGELGQAQTEWYALGKTESNNEDGKLEREELKVATRWGGESHNVQ